MVVIRRLGIVQATSLLAAVTAAIAGGITERSWTWAFAGALIVYVTFRVGAAIWMDFRFRSARTWLDIDHRRSGD
jgi:hypothetical protein